MSEHMSHSGDLKRGLKNRHIQLIALGGAIGTGLFLGSAGVLKSAGPSMILGYALCGFIAFMIMRQLGEMIVEEPVAGLSAILHINTGAVLPAFCPAGTAGCCTSWWACPN
jgi:aromatic amino acid transport protein AroP